MARSAKKEVVTIDLPSRLDLVTVVRMIVASSAAAGSALKGNRLEDLRLATSEAVTNAIQANLVEGPSGRVRLTCEVFSDRVKLTIVDQGAGMADVLPLPNMTHPDRLSIEGGFGVPLIKKLSGGLANFTSSRKGTTVEFELKQ